MIFINPFRAEYTNASSAGWKFAKAHRTPHGCVEATGIHPEFMKAYCCQREVPFRVFHKGFWNRCTYYEWECEKCGTVRVMRHIVASVRMPK